MTLIYSERVAQGLNLLRDTLRPKVEKILRDKEGPKWFDEIDRKMDMGGRLNLVNPQDFKSLL